MMAGFSTGHFHRPVHEPTESTMTVEALALNDTIAAIASARGEGAIAVIRISGAEAHRIAGSCLSGAIPFDTSEARQINRFSFVDPQAKTMIDDVTAIRYQAPRSYTGEDMAELFCHGGGYVVECILACLLRMGARLAHPGEFTRRGLLDGKFDLLKAESIQALVNSTTAIQHRNAVEMYRGESIKAIAQIRDRLEDALVDIESRIEFGDEDDVYLKPATSISDRISASVTILAEEIERRSRYKKAEKGVIVAILGETNAGKSSLFNALLEAERSIVHSSKGTTRDFISENIIVDKMPVSLLDTAGIGMPENEVEAQGIERSWQYIEQAEVAIFVTSAASESLTPEELAILERRGALKTIAVLNKLDLGPGRLKKEVLELRGIATISVCLLKDEDKKSVRLFFSEQLKPVMEEYSVVSFLLNTRQEAAAMKALEELQAIEIAGLVSEDQIAFHIKSALGHLGEFVGASASDKILDEVFSRFCIGK